MIIRLTRVGWSSEMSNSLNRVRKLKKLRKVAAELLSSKELVLRQRREVRQLQREEREVSRLLDKALGLKVCRLSAHFHFHSRFTFVFTFTWFCACMIEVHTINCLFQVEDSAHESTTEEGEEKQVESRPTSRSSDKPHREKHKTSRKHGSVGRRSNEEIVSDHGSTPSESSSAAGDKKSGDIAEEIVEDEEDSVNSPIHTDKSSPFASPSSKVGISSHPRSTHLSSLLSLYFFFLTKY